MKNSYKQRTKHLGIPVVGDNDSIWPEVELKKYQIIENLLLAGLKGMRNCIFDEGDLALEKKPDGKFRAVLRPMGVHPALEGIVGNAYFLASDVLYWDNLEPGSTYYLYVSRTSHTFSDERAVRTTHGRFEKNNRLMILVGMANLKGDKPSLDREPVGKIRVWDLEQHASETENPHGKTVVQDELMVRRRLLLGDGQDMDIVIRSGNEQVTVPVSCLVPGVANFVTSGKEGTVVTSSARVAFVQVSRMAGAEGKKAGEVAMGYFGQDPKVPNERSFVVYNDGDVGVPMRALIYFG